MSKDEPVMVLETGDQTLVVVAKSVLDSAGIRYIVQGEGLQNLLAMGSFGTGFNPLAGPVRLLVAPADEEAALGLLAGEQVDEGAEAGEEDQL